MVVLDELAVIIPVGPRDESWRMLLPTLHFLPERAEICVVFAASANLPTPTNLPNLRAKITLIQAAADGRAKQMNAAVAATRNRCLWFLHADSVLSKNTAPVLGRALRAPSALHYFDLKFHDGPARMGINAFGVWWRCRLFRMPFGDQGFLLTRADFLRLGGYDERLRSAEDHALVWRARHLGLPIRAIGASLSTSARRYLEEGWGKTTWKHLCLSFQQAREFSAERRGDDRPSSDSQAS